MHTASFLATYSSYWIQQDRVVTRHWEQRCERVMEVVWGRGTKLPSRKWRVTKLRSDGSVVHKQPRMEKWAAEMKVKKERMWVS